MADDTAERRLAAIVAADVAGYTRLIEADESGTRAALRALQEEEIAPRVRDHHGRIVSAAGDGLLMEFPSVVDAVTCAIKVQRALATRNATLTSERKILFRIGVNLGDVLVEDDDIHGEGVNLAARLQELAKPGAICVSGKVYEETRHRLDVGFEDLGTPALKNITEPVRVYRILIDPKQAGALTRHPGRTHNRHRWIAALVAGLAGLGVGLGLTFSGTEGGLRSDIGRASEARMAFALPERPSIAVLPFVNMGGAEDEEYFADGMTEDLITDLSKVAGLFVIARNSVFTYKGKAVRIEQVAEDLGVRYVLEGSVRRVGDDVRINAQLIDATGGHHIWAERYDRKFGDIFALQDEVVGEIVTALEINISEGEEAQLATVPTEDLKAYDLYLRARDSERVPTIDGNEAARRNLLQAISLDPNFAGAYEELGWTHFRDWVFGWSPDEHTLERAYEAAIKANTIGGARAGCHELISHIYLWQRRFDEAIIEAEKAVALDPNSARAYSALGETLTWYGRPEEAIGLIKHAMRLDPEYPFFYAWNLGHAQWLTGDLDKAHTLFATIVEHQPGWMPAHAFLAGVLFEMGRADEAAAAVRVMKDVAPHTSIEVIRARLPYRDPAHLDQVMGAIENAIALVHAEEDAA
jgi:TolB-like protein/class 3 adenylate cyclase